MLQHIYDRVVSRQQCPEHMQRGLFSGVFSQAAYFL